MTKSRIVKVFLSSTCYDLIDLRQELRAFLEKNGFTVALSEDPRSPFIVDPLDDSIGSCVQNVENSGLYLGQTVRRCLDAATIRGSMCHANRGATGKRDRTAMLLLHS